MSMLQKIIQKHVTSRYYIALVLVYLAGISAMLRANVFYFDDFGRALYGYADWLPSARPLTELFAWIFYLGPTTMDASPLTQIVAVIILAATSLVLIPAVRMRFSWWVVLCVIPVGLSPYGMENLTYKFDSPSMALSLFCAVLPAYIVQKHTKGTFIAAAMLAFASASLYQPAIGAYLAICIYLTLVDVTSHKPASVVIRNFLYFALSFIVGFGGYVVQAPYWYQQSEYTSYIELHSGVPALSEIPHELMENIPTYLSSILHDWSLNSLGWLFGGITVVFISTFAVRWAITTYKGIASKRCSLGQQMLRLFVMLALLFCFILSPFGLQMLLKNPVWAPRTFYGFGVALAILLLHLNRCFQRKPVIWAMRTLVVLAVWQLLVFAQVYGNLLSNQKEWESTRIILLAEDINSYIQKHNSSRITFMGTLGRAPLNINIISHYPLLWHLITVPLTSTGRWGYEELKTFGVTLEPSALTPSMINAPRTLFMEKPGYRIETGPENIGIITFLPLPELPKQKKVTVW